MNIVQFIILFVHPQPPSSSDTDKELNTPKFKPLSPPTEEQDTINRRNRNWGV